MRSAERRPGTDTTAAHRGYRGWERKGPSHELRGPSALLMVAVVVMGLLGFAPGAMAVIVHLSNGKAVSYQPLPGRGPTGFDQVFKNLDYNGGPVMSSNTNYPVFWDPAGVARYPADYKPGLDRYFIDLAHDSGLDTNVDSVATQYGDAFGKFANYDSRFGGELDVADPYPRNTCSGGAICITDAQIQTELNKVIAARHLPHDLSHEYFMLTPPGVVVCFGSAPTDACSVNAPVNPVFCAYHSYAATSTPFIYAVDPYVTGDTHGCDDANHPNGTSADGAIQGGLSHEHNESVTDPQPGNAWVDFGGFPFSENGDKCGGQPGPALGTASNGALYNQVVNGHFYWNQQEWSNKRSGCLQRFTLTGELPSAKFTSTPAGATTLTFNASGSTATGGVAKYNWQPNDSVPATSPQDNPIETQSPRLTYDFGKLGVFNVALTVFGPDGVSRGISELVKVGDEGPSGVLAVTTIHPSHVRSVAFSAAASKDVDGSIRSYGWNFGDGAAAVSGATPSHTYAKAGTYPVTLTVSDTSGQTAVVATNLTVL